MVKDKSLNQEYVCRNCGFSTCSEIDMLEHLGFKQEFDNENCVTQVIDIRKLTKKEIKRLS